MAEEERRTEDLETDERKLRSGGSLDDADLSGEMPSAFRDGAKERSQFSRPAAAPLQEDGKATLKWFVKQATVFINCDECPFEDGCPSGATVKECERHFFDGVLKSTKLYGG